MKIRSVVTLVFIGLALSFALPAFSQDQNTVDPEIRQQIEALFTNFSEAFNNHDPSAIAALYTDNAVRSESYWSEVGIGRQAIEKSYTAMLSSKT